MSHCLLLGTIRGRVAFTYIFIPKLVCCQMDGTIGAATNLFFDPILVDGGLRYAIHLVICVLGIESLLRGSSRRDLSISPLRRTE